VDQDAALSKSSENTRMRGGMIQGAFDADQTLQAADQVHQLVCVRPFSVPFQLMQSSFATDQIAASMVFV